MLDYYTINKNEYETLYGLPVAAQFLYFRGLKSQMNPSTYRMKGVSWNTITADLETLPAPGIKADRPSVAACKRSLNQLIKHGLIVSESEGVRLKIYFPLAERAKSVSSKAVRVADSIPDLIPDPIAVRLKEPQPFVFAWDLTIYDDKAERVAERVNAPIADPIAVPSNKDLTVPYRTYSDFENFEGILTLDEWKDFFVNRHGFDSTSVLLPVCIAMLEDWVRRGVDVELVAHAINLAAKRLNKPIPDNPSYYRALVDDLVDARNSHSTPRLANPDGISLFTVNGETLVAASGETQARKYFRKVSGFDVSCIEAVADNQEIFMEIRGESKSLPAKSLIDTWVSLGKSIPGIVLEDQSL
ncbi:MAG: hypothetical protein ACKVJE_17245 [Pseudomonadales bacterium]